LCSENLPSINESEKKCQIAYLLDMTFNLAALTGAFELSQTTNITYKKLDMQKGKPRTDGDRETKLI